MIENLNLEQRGNHSLAEVLREVRLGLINVIRSDFSLAKIELKDTTSQLKSDVAQIGIFGAIAALGIFPLIAFMIIGLGEVLGGRYWLSALLLAVAFFALGGGMAYRAFSAMKNHDLSMPHTRRAIDHEIAAMDRSLHNITVTKGKAA